MRRAALALLLVATGCGGDDEAPSPPPRPEIALTSPAFSDGGALPRRFTCDGRGVSPPLRWTGVPDDARDLALVVEDRDVAVSAFTHWTLWRLPFQPAGGGRVLEDGVAPEMEEGQNDAGTRGWEPACPPATDGPHRYEFTIHALDEVLDLRDGAPPAQVRAAITATSIGAARLHATYDR